MVKDTTTELVPEAAVEPNHTDPSAAPEVPEVDERQAYVNSILAQYDAAADKPRLQVALFADVLYNLLKQAQMMNAAQQAMAQGGIGGIMKMLRG